MSIQAFEGPEFQPNVISMKAAAERGGVDIFKNRRAQIQVVRF
jgi:hypothetical protein